MTKRFILSLGTWAFFSLSLFGQGSNNNGIVKAGSCGTHTYSPWLTWFMDNRTELTAGRDVDTSWLYVPMTIHIVGNNDGSGYYPEEGALRAVCEMNAQFEQARIFFYLLKGEEFVYHNNTAWNNHDWEGGADMILSTKKPDRINTYIVENPAGNCGYSWYDAVVMNRSCSGAGNSVWAHEVGHHLSLPHPFYGWEGQSWDYNVAAPTNWEGYAVEKVDRSNCHDSGDRFCDTEADYLNYRWSCNDVKRSTVVQKDPNGTTFSSDASLIMGYALDACQSRFTPEQIEAMRNNLYFEHDAYLQQMEPGQPLADGAVQLVNPIDSAIVQYDDIILHWSPVPEATFYNIEIGLFPNFVPIIESATVADVTNYTIQRTLGKNRPYFWRVRAYNEWDLCAEIPATYGIFRTRDLSSVNSLEQIADIQLLPNPVTNGQDVYISIANDEALDLVIEVHDIAGRICFESFQTAFAGENQYSLPTSDLSAGVYVVSIKTNKGVIIKQLVVAN